MKTEAETRQDLIDTKLLTAGWDVDNLSQVSQEFDISVPLPDGVSEPRTPYEGHQYSDYVLLGRDGKPLAVVEAKKSSKDAEVGREQAKQYCYNIQKEHGGKFPFCFYTNGLEIYFWDLENYPPRKVIGYPTRDDLERFQYIREHQKPLADELINTGIAGRDYQIRAIRAVMEGIEKKQRNFLLVMATGTGKTRTCIALVDALMRAGHAERVLFLVDRIPLREQGLDAFKEHLPNEPRWPHEGEKEISKDRRIYVTTYPRMLNIIREEPPSLSPHFFDLIVIDESHRSIYNTYGEVLDYFKAISLGLTATPTDIIDHNTFKLFNCDNGLPTFAYTYEEAVTHNPPYLCNFQVMKIYTKFQDEGISKRTISLEDQKKLILEGKEVSEINFDYFKLNPKGKDLTVQIPLPVRFAGIRLDKIEKALDVQEVDIAGKEIVKLRKQIAELPENSVVIQESATDLEKIKNDNYWTRLTHEKIEFLRDTIKPLFRTVSQYRGMVEKLIMELTERNPILKKIKEGQEVTEDEAEELANLLHDEHPHITEDLLKNVYNNRKAKFIQFIKHILGLEILESFPDTVSKAFDGFIHNHTNLTSRQLEFLSLLKDFILEKESVKKRDLIESPFTIIHPQGIRGIFSPVEIREILNMTDRLAG